jgi:beta-lactamase regulating signal transducer with metallopeptidase domain
MLWWFVETSLVAGLLATAALLSGRLRSISSTARHLLWLVVLIKLIMPPVIQSPWALPAPSAFWPAVETGTLTLPPSLLPTALPAPKLSTSEINGKRARDSSPVATCDAPGTSWPKNTRQAECVSVRGPSAGRSEWRRLLGRLDGRTLSIRSLLLSVWVLGTVVLALFQASRIVSFRRRLGDAVPAPTWLVQEAEQLGERLHVRVPEILAVPGLGTPLLWCLGRPKLLLPGHLIKSLEAARWRGVLIHELAHLRRGDQWVRRIELAAGLLWWWNPIYWLTCRRLDAEAELACDAWVVWALPHERLNYAEVLVRVCAQFSRPGSPSPVLGVAGSGQFFERRLSMILYGRAACRVSTPILVAVGLLAVLSLPSWTFAEPSALIGPRQDATPARAVSSPHPSASQIVDDRDDDDDDDDAMDDDADDDDQEDAKSSRDKAAAKVKEESQESKSEKGDVDIDVDVSGIEKQIESALGPDFEEKIEEWAEKFSKDIEEKFGENSEFVKKMEAFGEEMEKKFGDQSEFAKKMEAFGKEMEKKFGDQSEFAKNMENLGKEIEKKFGPGSDFEKKVKEKLGPGSDFEKKIKEKLGPGSDFEKNIKEKLGPGSDFEKKMKELGKDMERKVKEKQELEAMLKAKTEALSKKLKAAAERTDAEKPVKTDRPGTKSRTTDQKARDRRIEALEAHVQELLRELKALKDAGNDHEE